MYTPAVYQQGVGKGFVCIYIGSLEIIQIDRYPIEYISLSNRSSNGSGSSSALIQNLNSLSFAEKFGSEMMLEVTPIRLSGPERPSGKTMFVLVEIVQQEQPI